MSFDSRKIAALFQKKYKKYIRLNFLAYHLRNFFLIFLTLIALLQLQILVILTNYYKNAKVEYSDRIDQYIYWSGVVGQFPNIPDILYNASINAIKAGYKLQALNYIEKAIKIDPLFEEAHRLREELLKM